MNKRFVILGASKGLGLAVYEKLFQKNLEAHFLLSSRKIEKIPKQDRTILITQDFSKLPVEENFLEQLKKFQPTHLIYCAGGGPFGFFEEQSLKSHHWAMTVNFQYPFDLTHQILSIGSLKQFVFVGSAIAGNFPDSKASSYAAAKHALRGWVTSVQKENHLPIQFKLFEPGYFESDLLPLNSEPRKSGQAEKLDKVAEDLIKFIENDPGNRSSIRS